MLRNSPIVGTRQSQCPAKQGVAVPSFAVFRSFSLSRKFVYSVPFGSVKGVAPLHVYVLLTSCGSGQAVGVRHWTTVPTAPVFFSHISPVWLSQIVPSPLSVKRVGVLAGHATEAASCASSAVMREAALTPSSVV